MNEFSGRVSGFDAVKGFGFIADPDGGADDVFAHVNELVDVSQKGLLRDGAEVQFDIVDGDKGARAENIVVVTSTPDDDRVARDLTEALVTGVGSLTGEQIVAVRSIVIGYMNDRGMTSLS